MDEVVICGCLGHSSHEVGEFQAIGDRRKPASKTSTLNIGKVGFGLLKELISNIPWESAFDGIEVHEYWSPFKSCVFRAQ